MNATPEPDVHAARAWLGIIAASFVALALTALAGWVPTSRATGDGGTTAMLLGLALAWLCGAGGLLLPMTALHASARRFAQAVLGGLAVRFLLTLAAALGLWMTEPPAARAALLWLAIGQLIGLVVETGGQMRLGVAQAVRTVRRDAVEANE